MRKVPKLRFKEFSDEWEEKNILELCSMKARIGWQNLRKEEHLDKGEFYLITGTDFYLDKIKWDTAKFVEEERYLQDINIILKEGDILITKDGSIGKLAFVENIGNKKATLNNGIFRIRIEKENHYSKYFYYTFLSKRFKNFLQQLTAGSTIVHLYQKDFEKYKIAYSSLQEQEKIANFLSNVDKKISLTEEKLELFREYKKGVMQKIFSQELRFKDNNGNDYPEWEEKKLGDILKEYIEKTTINNQYPILSSTNKGIVLQNDYFNKQTASTNNIGYKIVPKDYFTYRSMSDTGEFTINIQQILEKGIVSPAYPVFNTDSENKLFIYYSLNYNEFIKEQILTLKEGGTRYALSYKKLEKLSILLPILEEQQKIADFLSSIDSKIESIGKELEGLKEFKRGLLQQMLV